MPSQNAVLKSFFCQMLVSTYLSWWSSFFSLNEVFLDPIFHWMKTRLSFVLSRVWWGNKKNPRWHYKKGLVQKKFKIPYHIFIAIWPVLFIFLSIKLNSRTMWEKPRGKTDYVLALGDIRGPPEVQKEIARWYMTTYHACRLRYLY